MVAAWGAICCTSPPCISISIRNHRATYAGIVEHGAFTINVPTRTHLVEVDYAGMVSGVNCDKFSMTGLTAVRSETVNAPYVLEFPLVLECKALHQLEIGSHTQFIGQVMDTKAETGVLNDQGVPLANRIDPLISCAGERAYFALGDFLDDVCSPGARLLNLESEEMNID
jgi:flavin reductase (DIM6/NTAB) family NADH-FMN oxidoreductase RutF